MGQNKKSFILHIDTLGILDELSDEQAGQLFKKIYHYHNPHNPKETQITQLVNLAFYSFKTQFDRDFEAYERVVERNRNNGNKGGRPVSVNPSKPKKPDSDSYKDSGKDKEIKKEETLSLFSEDFIKFVDWVNDIGDKIMKLRKPFTEKEYRMIKAEIVKGTYSLEDAKSVLEGMQNKKSLLKDYESAYLTFNIWMKRRKDNTGTNEIKSESKGKLPVASLSELNKPIK